MELMGLLTRYTPVLIPGLAVVHASAEWGVKHIVYCSAAFEEVESKPDSFDPKRKIERAIRATDMSWTFLHSTDFMQNWLPTARWELKTYRTVLLRQTFQDNPGRKIILVSARDIGRGGALAFTEPETWKNKKMPLAADALTIDELQQIYKEVMGEPMTETWWIVAAVAKWAEPTLKQLSNVSWLGRTDAELTAVLRQ